MLQAFKQTLTMCEPYTEEARIARENLSPSELHAYPLFSFQHWSMTGHDCTGTIKEYIESIITSSFEEMKEFIDLTIARGITVIPYLFHGSIDSHPRGYDENLHPLFRGFFLDRPCVFQSICYILEKTDYHLFPQPSELFNYLREKDYLSYIKDHPNYESLVAKLFVSAMTADTFTGCLEYRHVSPDGHFSLLHITPEDTVETMFRKHTDVQNEYRDNIDNFVSTYIMEKCTNTIFPQVCELLVHMDYYLFSPSELYVDYLFNNGYLSVIKEHPLRGELLHKFSSLPIKSKTIRKEIANAIKEFQISFVRMESEAHTV